MHAEKVLRIMATDLPTIRRQLQSADPALRAAGLQRLADFEEMTAIWRGRSVSRRGVLRQAGASFVALSLGRDD